MSVSTSRFSASLRLRRCRGALAFAVLAASVSVGADSGRGGAIPDAALLNRDGEMVRLRSDVVGDRLAVMNFVFTHCATVCIPQGATFGRLQQLLGERLGSEVVLVSVSVDPVRDTPARMKAWGAQFGAGPDWALLTGSKQDVDAALKRLAVFTPDAEDHAPLLIIANADGSILQRVPGLLPPRRLLQLIEAQLAATPAVGASRSSTIYGG